MHSVSPRNLIRLLNGICVKIKKSQPKYFETKKGRQRNLAAVRSGDRKDSQKLSGISRENWIRNRVADAYNLRVEFITFGRNADDVSLPARDFREPEIAERIGRRRPLGETFSQ
jgi:hypothetical protein